ncbi:hypothetical protein E3P77_03286 [Wallemia ichthyophaga]|nr:hypothetical protein E3P77_03286 [Wallemia ichthyophaga]
MAARALQVTGPLAQPRTPQLEVAPGTPPRVIYSREVSLTGVVREAYWNAMAARALQVTGPLAPPRTPQPAVAHGNLQAVTCSRDKV